MISQRSAADYLAALLALLPRGRALSKTVGSVINRLMAGLSSSFARLDALGASLLRERPDTTDYLLPEWEATLGLPDECQDNPTVAERKAAVLARFTGVGGETAGFYEAYAAALGYNVIAAAYDPTVGGRPFLMDYSGMEDPIGDGFGTGGGDLFTYYISGPVIDAYLECEMIAVQPAHTTLIFNVI